MSKKHQQGWCLNLLPFPQGALALGNIWLTPG